MVSQKLVVINCGVKIRLDPKVITDVATNAKYNVQADSLDVQATLAQSYVFEPPQVCQQTGPTNKKKSLLKV